MTNYHPATYVNPEEAAIIDRFITPGSVVFDVGANVGGWTTAVLCTGRAVSLHLFEPVPETFEALRANPLLTEVAGLAFNRLALGECHGERVMQVYRDCAEMSGFYRRSPADFERIAPPEPVAVPVETLDGYCRRNAIRHINFLKLDVEGAELEVLKGAARLLRHARIDMIQFEYGGTYADAGVTLGEAHALLLHHGYTIYRLQPGRLLKVGPWRPELETYRYANFLAIHDRILTYALGEPSKPFILPEICATLGIRARGVLHIGANDGGELGVYRDMGMERILYVEANPEVASRLASRLAGEAGIAVIGCAVGEREGRVTFHVTSNSQCSSLLPLGRHRAIYPGVVETATIEVECLTIDGLFTRFGIDPAGFNLLNLDIQGAELLALRGAARTLRHIEGILVEVNFDELYEGCAQIDDLDDFLEPLGFRRVALSCPFHPSWGDAFYARVAPPAA